MRVGLKLALAALGLTQCCLALTVAPEDGQSHRQVFLAAQAQGPSNSAVHDSGHDSGHESGHDPSHDSGHEPGRVSGHETAVHEPALHETNGHPTAGHESTPGATPAAQDTSSTASFSGHWEALGHPDGIDFDLRLRQRGAKISGHHMAVNYDGTKIDGFLGNEPPSVDGEIKAGSKEAELQFKSSFASTPGKARIKLRGKRLIWTVTSPPEGNYYLPGEAVLVRTGS